MYALLCMQVSGSILDDDAHYVNCSPLTLTSANGTSFDFQGVRNTLKQQLPQECILTPPDAVGDPTAQLTPAQLSNQAVLAARGLVMQYYEGTLKSDDEMSPLETRNVVMRSPPADAPPGCCPVPDVKSGALLSRSFGEEKLYTQV